MRSHPATQRVHMQVEVMRCLSEHWYLLFQKTPYLYVLETGSNSGGLGQCSGHADAIVFSLRRWIATI